MHVSRSKVDDYLFSWNPETHGLQGRYCPEQAFFYCGICKPDKMNSYAAGHVNFNSYRYGVDSDAFCAMNSDEHKCQYLVFK